MKHTRKIRWGTYGRLPRQAILAGFVASGILCCTPSLAEVALRDADLTGATRQLFGVAVHFAPSQDVGYAVSPTLKIFNQLGLDSYREDLNWPNFVQSRNRIPERLRPFRDGVAARPLMILTYQWPGVGQSELARPGAWQNAYGAFARAAAARLSPSGLLEIGNEWNLARDTVGDRFNPSGPANDPRSPASYARLARATAAALGRRDVPLLSGEVGEDPGWKWTEAMVRAGGVPVGAHLSVHLYNHCKPVGQRTAADAIEQMEDLGKMLGRVRRHTFKVYLTEIGWPTSDPAACGVSPLQQAQNLSQFLLWTSAQSWIAGVWLYELKDQASALSDQEKNFGLFRHDYSEKPAACAVRETLRLIRHAQRVHLTQPVRGVRMLVQSAGREKHLIMWTDDPKARGSVHLSGSTLPVRTLCGKVQAAGTITFDSTPIIIPLSTLSWPRINVDIRQHP